MCASVSADFWNARFSATTMQRKSLRVNGERIFTETFQLVKQPYEMTLRQKFSYHNGLKDISIEAIQDYFAKWKFHCG